MSHTDHGQPDLTALASGDRVAPLARNLAHLLTEARLTVRHCASHNPLSRLGGRACCRYPAGSGTAPGGISVSWTTHDPLLRDQHRHSTYCDSHQAMNAALSRVLRAFGYRVMPFGSGGAWLVTGRPRRETEAGQ